MTEIIEKTAEKIPLEIRSAIAAFNNDTKQAIVITLIDEGALAFSELKDQLSSEEDEIHNQTLSNSLRALQRGGLINKRATSVEEGPFDAYYEVSEYGERFVHCLLESLGSVDSFERADTEFAPVNHIQRQDGDGPVLVEEYHQTSRDESVGTEEQHTPPAQ
ncbi:winged helix-turn-helix transcriptional regulator (plasmid) [Haloarcula salina]|uniref:winged helix-turn-helix transcriptional regulator n=1 Tax=Haloarcula salina TaxID=1429914 RepID=UPI003C6FC516